MYHETFTSSTNITNLLPVNAITAGVHSPDGISWALEPPVTIIEKTDTYMSVELRECATAGQEWFSVSLINVPAELRSLAQRLQPDQRLQLSVDSEQPGRYSTPLLRVAHLTPTLFIGISESMALTGR